MNSILKALILIVAFLLVQFIPQLEPFIAHHPHLIALLDAIVSAIAVWIATHKPNLDAAVARK